MLLAIGLLAGRYTLLGGGTGMSVAAMSTLSFPPPVPTIDFAGAWDGAYWLTMTGMWLAMMMAMMAPSAAVAAAGHRSDQGSWRYRDGIWFALGYLLPWLGYAIAGTLVQAAFESAGLLHGIKMWSTYWLLSAGLLAIAGGYQFTGWKARSLSHCRRASSNRPSRNDGVRTGLACVGSCWLLMLLLFVGGLMNAYWMVALAIVAIAERLLPANLRFETGVGFGLLAAAAYVVAG